MLWKDKYSIGVEVIDAQHKELFHRVEAFLEALRSTASWEDNVQRVNETLEFMRGYVVQHFRDEELFQQSIGYPSLAEHRRCHNEMTAYVLEVSAEYEKRGFDEQLMQQFAGRLLAWLINHVSAEDQLIAVYARGKGASRYAR